LLYKKEIWAKDAYFVDLFDLFIRKVKQNKKCAENSCF